MLNLYSLLLCSLYLFINIIPRTSSEFSFTWHVAPIALLFLPNFQTKSPDIIGCCQSRGVSTFCVENLCQMPSNSKKFDFTVYEVPIKCSQYLTDAAYCIADGRNHSSCCKSMFKGVSYNCLHLCTGSPYSKDTSHGKEFDDYLSCLIFNTMSIFTCAQKGYEKIPGPPSNVTVTAVTNSTVDITWIGPTKSADKVAGYVIYYYQDLGMNDANIVKVAAGMTSKLSYKAVNLNPDMKYGIYVIAQGANQDEISLPSESVFFTTNGVPPDVEAYQSELTASINDTKTLVCKIYATGTKRRPLTVIWQQKRPDSASSTFESISDNIKYEANLYAASEPNILDTDLSTRHIYIASLYIQKIGLQDFGTYRCLVKSNFGESSKDIHLTHLNALKIPRSPPNVTECCLNENVKRSCLFACQSDPSEPIDAKALKASDEGCGPEMPKISRCAIKRDLDTGSCCLRKKVPLKCLPICEKGGTFLPAQSGSGLASSTQILITCQAYNSAIFCCVIEDRSKVPFPPAELKLKSLNSATATAIIEWQPVLLADAYHVFYREANTLLLGPSAWKRITVANTAASLNSLKPRTTYIAVVLSANSAGFSDASRPLEFSS